MKISKITLKGYNQFKDVQFEFTYPKGHKNAGEPLKKICFIGQSGTGKTSILRLIKVFVSKNKKIGPNLYIEFPKKNTVIFEMYQGDLFGEVASSNSSLNLLRSELSSVKISRVAYVEKSDKYSESKKPLLINYPAEVIRGKGFSINDENVITKEIKIKEKLEYISTLEPKNIIDFAVEEIETIRNFVFKEIKEHRAKELLFKSEISEVVLSQKSTPQDIAIINLRYENWLNENPNPLTKLANECLDPILNLFGLKVKTQIDLDTILALGDIQLQTLQGVDVERSFWSTGTRQIVDTIVPMFELKPKDAVILIDEPEKSLFPDIQEMIIDYYVKLNPSCQFFFATHSPIIASAFEPWEVFYLEYDESNKFVRINPNYKKERHVDNYDYYPKYLNFNSILMNVFRMEDEGSSQRKELLTKVASKYNNLIEMRKQGKQNTIKFKKDKEEFFKLAKKVGWDEKSIKV